MEEMRWPLTVTDDAQWVSGFGLGLIVVPRPERVVHVGHDGAMPGFIASAYGRVADSDSPAAFAVAALASGPRPHPHHPTSVPSSAGGGARDLNSFSHGRMATCTPGG
jgi:hypothetical protein